jgi:hypothetical protein
MSGVDVSEWLLRPVFWVARGVSITDGEIRRGWMCPAVGRPRTALRLGRQPARAERLRLLRASAARGVGDGSGWEVTRCVPAGHDRLWEERTLPKPRDPDLRVTGPGRQQLRAMPLALRRPLRGALARRGADRRGEHGLDQLLHGDGQDVAPRGERQSAREPALRVRSPNLVTSTMASSTRLGSTGSLAGRMNRNRRFPPSS